MLLLLLQPQGCNARTCPPYRALWMWLLLVLLSPRRGRFLSMPRQRVPRLVRSSQKSRNRWPRLRTCRSSRSRRWSWSRGRGWSLPRNWGSGASGFSARGSLGRRAGGLRPRWRSSRMYEQRQCWLPLCLGSLCCGCPVYQFCCSESETRYLQNVILFSRNWIFLQSSLVNVSEFSPWIRIWWLMCFSCGWGLALYISLCCIANYMFFHEQVWGIFCIWTCYTSW